MNKQIVATDQAPKAIGPYSQGLKISCTTLLFISGQIPLKPDNGELVAEGIVEQTKQVLENIRAIVQAAGGSLEHIIKTTIYLTNLEDYSLMNETYSRFFEKAAPARATVQVTRLPKGAKVEIEAIAAF